jgi:hypothetical protein
MKPPFEEGVNQHVCEYLREYLSNKIHREGKQEYLFLWNGKYPETRAERKTMFQAMNNPRLLDTISRHVYFWDQQQQAWKITGDDPQHLLHLEKIQKKLFSPANLPKPAKVFGFLKQGSKSGFAIYIQKEAELNKNKGAVCQYKTKQGAVKSYLEEVLQNLRPDIPELQLNILEKWLKDDSRLQPVSCVASELLLQLSDLNKKRGDKYYLDMEEFFFFQWTLTM